MPFIKGTIFLKSSVNLFAGVEKKIKILTERNDFQEESTSC